MSIATGHLPDDIEALKTMVRAYQAMVELLQARIARLKRQRFGASSEKIEREIEQLELALEGVEAASAACVLAAEEPEPEAPQAQSPEAPKPARGKPRLREGAAERERIVLDPGETCPDCGGALRLIGEDTSEMLDLITAKLKLIEIARPKKSCRVCEKVAQEPAPTRPIARSSAGPNLLAYILVSKFDDHLPLYRQGEIFARMGVDIPRSTLIDWCGGAVRVLRPLTELIRAQVMNSDRLHADDTPVRMLDPSRKVRGKQRGVREGRIWVYLRDDRPWGGADPPGAAYFFSPDRKGEHPQSHLASFEGVLQADAYGGFKKLYQPDASGKVRIREAACWAHLRRDFHDVWKQTSSSLAQEALAQIGALYDIEREISGQSADRRRVARQQRSKPRVAAFAGWCEGNLARVPGKSDLARAMRYFLRRRASFELFLADGRVAIDNNPAERAIRPIAIGRKNFLFAGSHAGGELLAEAMTLIETAKLSGLDPQEWLADVLARINDHKINRLAQLLPWNWTPLASRHTKAA